MPSAIRLSGQRRSARRRLDSRWPLFGLGALAVIIYGAACWQPLVPAPLAPATTGDTPLPPTAVPAQLAPPTIAPALPTQTPAPLVPQRAAIVPAPVPPVPTLAPPPPRPQLGPVGQALLTSIRVDRTSPWLKNHAETPLRGGPEETAAVFTTLPQWTTLRQMDSRPGWVMVFYPGDGATREPGPGWVRSEDVGGIGTPEVWIASAHQAPLWMGPADGAGYRFNVPPSTLMEVIGADGEQGSRLRVRLPGDGRQVPPAEGWFDASDAGRTRIPSAVYIPWTYPRNLSAELRLPVPYRTQLDGSSYAQANCGPTSLGMALELYGVNVPQKQLRSQVMAASGWGDSDDAGSYIWALAQVAEENGLRVNGLYEADDTTYRRWSVDDVREQLRGGRPVIAQVHYRSLPRRGDSDYWDDHFVVLTGLMGDSFLYNDPIGGTSEYEGPGWDRIMSAAELRKAMNASDRAFAFTAFSVSR